VALSALSRTRASSLGHDKLGRFDSSVCPSPVPQEVEKRCEMMGTYADYGGCESPGHIAFPQVNVVWRSRAGPAFQAGNASSIWSDCQLEPLVNQAFSALRGLQRSQACP